MSQDQEPVQLNNYEFAKLRRALAGEPGPKFYTPQIRGLLLKICPIYRQDGQSALSMASFCLTNRDVDQRIASCGNTGCVVASNESFKVNISANGKERETLMDPATGKVGSKIGNPPPEITDIPEEEILKRMIINRKKRIKLPPIQEIASIQEELPPVIYQEEDILPLEREVTVTQPPLVLSESDAKFNKAQDDAVLLAGEIVEQDYLRNNAEELLTIDFDFIVSQTPVRFVESGILVSEMGQQIMLPVDYPMLDVLGWLNNNPALTIDECIKKTGFDRKSIEIRWPAVQLLMKDLAMYPYRPQDYRHKIRNERLMEIADIYRQMLS